MMLLIILLVGLVTLLYLSSVRGVEDANERIAQELGDQYNPAAAGNPGCDGLLLTVVTIVGVLLVVGALATALPVLP